MENDDKYSGALTAIGGRKVALTLLGLLLAVAWGLLWHFAQLKDTAGEAVLWAIVGLVTAYVTGNAVTRVARARTASTSMRSSGTPGASPDSNFP